MTHLTDLLTARGPFASVALAAPSAVVDPDSQLERRWTAARRELAAGGLGDADLETLDTTVAELAHDEGASVVLLQPTGGSPYVEFLDDAIERDLAVVDALPRLGPILESRQATVPHMIVVTDRTGADVIGFGDDSESETAQVEGETLHIQRSHPGGWSQRRFQQRAENVWESNAGEVAERVTAMARELGARVVTVAGDVRAVAFLLDQLPPEVRDLTVKLEGQSDELIAEQTSREVANVVASDTRAALERFREEVGQGRGAEDVAGVLESLTAGRVETLLVHDDPDDLRRAVFNPEGSECSTDHTGEVTVPDASEGRLVDVAIRSALLTDAEVRFVPLHGGPTGQLGALLRW